MPGIEDQLPPNLPAQAFNIDPKLAADIFKKKEKLAEKEKYIKGNLASIAQIAQSQLARKETLGEKKLNFDANYITLDSSSEHLESLDNLVDQYASKARENPEKHTAPIFKIALALQNVRKEAKALKKEAADFEEQRLYAKELTKKLKHIDAKLKNEVNHIFQNKLSSFPDKQLPLEHLFFQTDKGLHQATTAENIEVEELQNGTPRLGIESEGIVAVPVRNEEEGLELQRINPNVITFIPSDDVQAQADQLLQEAVQRYIAYRLESAKNESKKEEGERKSTEHASTSPFTYHYTPTERHLTRRAPILPENKLLNIGSQLFTTFIKIIQHIMEAKREEKAQQAAQEKKERIEAQELKREILKVERHTAEIQKGEIKKTEDHQSQVKGEINATEKTRSAPPPRPTQEQE